MALASTITDALSAMPDALERTFALFSPSMIRWTPDQWDGVPGEQFSALGQLCHLRDIERDGYHVRFQRIVDEVHPSLESLDGYALAAARRYDDDNPREVSSAFRAARVATVATLKRLSDDDLRRRATFAEHGVVTTTGLVHLLCSHDQQHLATLHWLLSRTAAL